MFIGPDVKSILASLKKTKVIDINDESLRKDLPAMNIDGEYHRSLGKSIVH